MHLETFLFESLLANRWRTPKRKVPCGYFSPAAVLLVHASFPTGINMNQQKAFLFLTA